MRRHQRVAGEAWRVRATSGVGASEPALPRYLRCDIVLCCCVMSYSVLIWLTTVAIPQPCRRSLYRHRHRRRTADAARPPPPLPLLLLLLCGGCFAAAAVGASFVCFIKKKTGCPVVVMIVVIEPGRAAVRQLIWRGYRQLRPRRCWRCRRGCGCGCGVATALLLCRCCAAAAVLLFV